MIYLAYRLAEERLAEERPILQTPPPMDDSYLVYPDDEEHQDEGGILGKVANKFRSWLQGSLTQRPHTNTKG